MARLTFSPRRRCAWLVLSCRAGWWWRRGQPQASLRMACPFVSGGVVVAAGSAPGVAAHGLSFRVGRGGGGGGVSPRRRCAWLVLSCRAGWWWRRGQPQASLRMACPFVSGGVVVAGSAPGVAAHGLSFRVGRGGGGGGGVSPRRRCAWLVLSCRAGWWWRRGQPQASLRMACPFVSGGVVVAAGSAPGVAAHGLSFRVGRGGGGGGVSPRRRCAWLVLSCRAGWWWRRGQPQASLRMACPFVSGGVVVAAGSAPGVAAHGLSFRVGRGGGGGGVSPRRRCAWHPPLCSNFLRVRETCGPGYEVANVRYVGNRSTGCFHKVDVSVQIASV